MKGVFIFDIVMAGRPWTHTATLCVWRHDMDTLSALLALYDGKPLVKSPHKGPVSVLRSQSQGVICVRRWTREQQRNWRVADLTTTSLEHCLFNDYNAICTLRNTCMCYYWRVRMVTPQHNTRHHTAHLTPQHTSHYTSHHITTLHNTHHTHTPV